MHNPKHPTVATPAMMQSWVDRQTTNDDRPTKAKITELPQLFASICSDYEDHMLQEAINRMNRMPTGDLKNLDRANITYHLHCGNSQYQGNPIGPERRRTAQRGTRVAFERPATW
jgi:hypothetical protein